MSNKFAPEALAAYRDLPLSFNPLLPEVLEGEAAGLETGALLQDNGDILFRINAPGAKEVRVNVATNMAHSKAKDRACKLERQDNGLFEGVYPYNGEYAGYHTVDVVIDGTTVLYPYIPVVWAKDRPVNMIEVPDPETPYINLNNVPHGAISREIYWSEALNSWQRCMVYTPPGYQKSGESYPVLYLQHGATENETCWSYNGRVGNIMDNLIAAGECVPFIIVMNDGMARAPEDLEPGAYKFAGFERSLIESCIPFIESTYRVKTDKANRAIAGLSMGSSQSLHFGMHHPELFASVGMFSAPLRFRGNQPQVVELFMNKAHLESNYRLILRTVGDAETIQYESFMKDEEELEELGIKSLPLYHTAVYHNCNHEWGCWRRAIHDFAKLLFR